MADLRLGVNRLGNDNNVVLAPHNIVSTLQVEPRHCQKQRNATAKFYKWRSGNSMRVNLCCTSQCRPDVLTGEQAELRPLRLQRRSDGSPREDDAIQPRFVILAMSAWYLDTPAEAPVEANDKMHRTRARHGPGLRLL